MKTMPESREWTIFGRAVLGTTMLMSGVGIAVSVTNATRQKVGTTLAIPSPEQKPVELSLEEEQKRRAELADLWLTCAQEVATETNDEEAKMLFQFMNDNADLAMPTDKGIRLLTNRNAPHRFYFVPLIDGDKQGINAKRNASAWYQPNPGVLAVKAGPKSRFGRGVDMLHEGHHVHRSRRTDLNWKDPDAFCSEERETHAFQHRLYSGIGGPLYHMIVEQEKERLKMMKGGGKISTTYADRLSYYDTRLDDAFEKAESEAEEDDRQTNVWIDAVFRTIQQKHTDPETAAKKQAVFLREVYEKQGLLPAKQ